MGWSEEVHNSRLNEAVVRARKERQLRRNGEKVLVQPNAGPGAFVVTAATVGVFLLWKHYEKDLSKIKWRELPVIREFDALLTGAGKSTVGQRIKARSAARSTSPTTAKPAAAAPSHKTKATPASASSKASKANDKQGRPLYGKPATNTSTSITPGMAAAAAAATRASKASTNAAVAPAIAASAAADADATAQTAVNQASGSAGSLTGT